MAVPYIFANVTTSIPLSQLDNNFATAITLGNASLVLGNTTTSVGNLTLANTTISSGNATLTNLTVGAVASFAAGSSSAPSIAATGDLDTGMWFPAANTTAFSTGGTERMRIDSSGNVGIGVTADSGVRLDVRGGVIQFLGIGGNTGQLLTDASGLTLKNVSNGYMLFGTNNTERMRIPSGGGLLVGCTAVPSSTVAGRRIEVGSGATTSSSGTDTTAYSHWTFINGNGSVGSIQTSGSATSYVTSSDYRLKYNIAPMTGALAKVAALNPVTYKWKSDNSDGQGFIAHELQEVVPECVTGEKDATREEEYEITPAIPAVVDADGVEVTPAVEAVRGTRTVPSYQGVDTSFLVATLVAAIQELKVIIDAQATRIDALESN